MAMATCPAGHESPSSDFCDVCGIRMDGAPATAPAAVPDRPTPPAAEPCPRCGTGRPGQPGQFCEACGFDFESRSAPAAARAPTGWVAEVASDHAYFDKVIAQDGADAGTLRFPAYCPRRRFRITGPEVRIGRRSLSRGIEPEIDLTGPPTDPGVSRMHAVLIPEPDGGLTVIDPGSENGTLVNRSEIVPGVRIPLSEGATIHLGAWTVITIRAAHI
jgi:hypothetical protein